jgi:hypothetical protein
MKWRKIARCGGPGNLRKPLVLVQFREMALLLSLREALPSGDEHSAPVLVATQVFGGIVNSRTLVVTVIGLALAYSGTQALNGQPAPRSPQVIRPDQRGARIVQIHLSSVQVTPDGTPVVGAPVVRALMQLDCQTNRYRRLGADVERADGVVMILDTLAAYGWRSPVAGDPEALQLEAACKVSR